MSFRISLQLIFHVSGSRQRLITDQCIFLNFNLIFRFTCLLCTRGNKFVGGEFCLGKFFVLAGRSFLHVSKTLCYSRVTFLENSQLLRFFCFFIYLEGSSMKRFTIKRVNGFSKDEVINFLSQKSPKNIIQTFFSYST